jgi:hypothetical protein
MCAVLKSDDDCMPCYVHNTAAVFRVILLRMIMHRMKIKAQGTKNGFLDDLDCAVVQFRQHRSKVTR